MCNESGNLSGLALRITDVLDPEAVIPSLEARDKHAVLEEIVTRVSSHYGFEDPQRLLDVVRARERICSTAIGEGVAIPHGKLPGLKRVFIAFARSREGVDFDAQDGTRTHLFFLLVAPEGSASEHLSALARVSRLVKDASLRERLMRVQTPEEVVRLIEEKERDL